MLKLYEFKKPITIILILSITLYTFYRPIKMVVNPNVDHSLNFSMISYRDLDRQLCKVPTLRTINSTSQSSTGLRCPENEKFVSIAILGRTGNLMWAYASVLAIAQQTGLKAYIPSCLKRKLNDYFENLTIPTFEKNININCPVKPDSFVQSIDDWRINPQQSIILPRYMVLPREIIPWIPNIWREFTLKKNLRDSAQQTLKYIIKNLSTNNYTFVGVHVRRKDYKSYLQRKYGEHLASPQFFLKAMEYFKQKYSPAIFIIVSDDPDWCVQQFEHLENVFVVKDNLNKKNGPQLDLAIMVACNHTIYDYGTFGEWGAILAGGEVICYDMIQNSKDGSMQYNKSWQLMS